MTNIQRIRTYFESPLTLMRFLQFAGFVAVCVVVVRIGIDLLPNPGAALRVLTHVGLVSWGVPSWSSPTDTSAFAKMVGVCLTMIGLVGLPFAFALRRRLAIVTPAHDHAQHGGTRRPHWIAGAVCVALLVTAVTTIKNFDLFWADFDRSGIVVVGYTGSRFLLACLLLLACTTLGERLIAIGASNYRKQICGSAELLILSFFLGSTLYAFAGTLLGLAGMLTLPMALFLIAPPLLFAPALIGETATSFMGCIRSAGQQDTTRFAAYWILGWIALCSAILLLLGKGLYPATLDGDVWVHYLHYYRDVLRTGHIVSQDLWYDFLQSKGAGLFFLSTVLGDALSVQLVSWCYTLVAGLIVFDLIKRATSDAAWAITGVTAFFACLAAVTTGGDITSSFFKNHESAAALVAFLAWVAIRLLEAHGRDSKPHLAIAILVSAYLGFLVPVVAGIVTPFFLLLSIVVVLQKSGVARSFLFPATAIIAGGVLSYAVNYVATGLLDIVPFGLLWPFADQERVFARLGTSGILYFLYYETGLQQINPLIFLKTNLKLASHLLRYDFLQFLLPSLLATVGAMALAVTTLCSASSATRNPATTLLLVVIAFLLPAVALYLFVSNPSVYRLYIFCAPFTIVAALLLAHAAFEWTLPPVARLWGASIFLVLASTTAIVFAIRDTGHERFRSIAGFVIGQRSVSDTMMEVDNSPYYVGDHARLPVITEFRRLLGPEPKILTFNHGAAPGYAFPGTGVVSEPSYTLGPRHLDIVYGEPETAKAVLQGLGINHFYINIELNLFTSVAFSRLFSPENIGRFLKVESSQGSDYLLGWRVSDDDPPLPVPLIQMLELKRAAVLYVPFSAEFSTQAEKLMAGEFGNIDGASISGKVELQAIITAGESLAFLLQKELRKQMLLHIYRAENHELVGRILDRVSVSLAQELPPLAGTLWTQNPDNYQDMIRNVLGARAMQIIRAATLESCAESLPRSWCHSLVTRSQRVHFGYGDAMTRAEVMRLLGKADSSR